MISLLHSQAIYNKGTELWL